LNSLVSVEIARKKKLAQTDLFGGRDVLRCGFFCHSLARVKGLATLRSRNCGCSAEFDDGWLR
jgi:hypothetical protein